MNTISGLNIHSFITGSPDTIVKLVVRGYIISCFYLIDSKDFIGLFRALLIAIL